MLRREGFSRVLQSRAQITSWFAIHWVDSGAGHARLGATVGKRVAPTAVARNRLKRLIREQFRKVARQGSSRDVVIRLRKQPGRAEWREAVDALRAALERILAVNA
ncbi:MAG: ribonuclease P protein component [Gammaproteobacteria bacterium]|nr:ribonuclease P protein component [Gammaproteobacteria bacterium]